MPQIPDVTSTKVKPRVRYGVITKQMDGRWLQCIGDGMPVTGLLTQEYAQDWMDRALVSTVDKKVVAMFTFFVEVD